MTVVLAGTYQAGQASAVAGCIARRLKPNNIAQKILIRGFMSTSILSEPYID
jgi:hypothetical protein